MSWHVICLMPSLNETVDEFPFYVGRLAGPTPNCVIIEDPTISRKQFSLEERDGDIYYINHSVGNAGELDGEVVRNAKRLSPAQVHILRLGDITIALGTDYTQTSHAAADCSVELYMVTRDDKEIGPLAADQLIEGCEKGYFTRTTSVRTLRDPGQFMNMEDVVDFDSLAEARGKDM